MQQLVQRGTASSSAPRPLSRAPPLGAAAFGIWLRGGAQLARHALAGLLSDFDGDGTHGVLLTDATPIDTGFLGAGLTRTES